MKYIEFASFLAILFECLLLRFEEHRAAYVFVSVASTLHFGVIFAVIHDYAQRVRTDVAWHPPTRMEVSRAVYCLGAAIVGVIDIIRVVNNLNHLKYFSICPTVLTIAVAVNAVVDRMGEKFGF